MTYPTMLTKKEQFLRKEWLVFTILIYFVLTPFRVVNAFNNYSQGLAEDQSTTLLTVLILFGIFGCLFFYILYRCAYKKPGTRYLMFLLIVNGFGLLNEIVTMSKNPPEYRILTTLFFLSVYSWWCVLAYKLRQLNFKIRTLLPTQTQPQLDSPS